MPVLAVVLAYVCGSVPTAYLMGRLVKGIDLRTRGSGNLGATNVYREIGAAAAALVLLIDGLKGWVAVAIVPRVLGLDGGEWLPLALGAAAVLGHAKPVFLLWRGGGKGVATTAGVFLALAPVAVGIAVLAFTLVVAATRYVSLGSLVSAIALSVVIAIQQRAMTPLVIVSAAISAFIVWGHRKNIQRLMHGQETRLGRPGQGAPTR